MNDAQTIERLYDLRLGAMAEAFAEEIKRAGDPALSFAERFGLLVERQWAAREEGRLAGLPQIGGTRIAQKVSKSR